MLFVLKSSIFFFVLYDCVTMTVTCVTPSSCFVTGVTITCDIISHLLFNFKIKKDKMKSK